MKKITAIREQAKRSGRVNIFVNGSFFIGIKKNLVVDLGLYVGKELNEAELSEISAKESYHKVLDRAFRLLTYRARSSEEMRKRLLEKGERAEVEKVIAYLKEINYLDDSDFVKRWIEERSKNRGARLLKAELFKKGISGSLAEAALADLTKEQEVANAKALVDKKKAYLKLPELERRKKISDYLARRGYGYGVISDVLKTLD